MSKSDAIGLRDEPQECAVAIEQLWAFCLYDLKRGLLIAIHESVTDRSRRVLVGRLDRLVAEPFDMDDLGYPIRSQPLMNAPACKSSRFATANPAPR